MSEDAANDKGDPSRPNGGVKGDEERKDSNQVGIVINESSRSLEQEGKKRGTKQADGAIHTSPRRRLALLTRLSMKT